MSITKLRLPGRKFHHKVGRDTHVRIIFTIFFKGRGIENVQFAMLHKRGQFSKDYNQAMLKLRKTLQLPSRSKEFRQEVLDLVLKEIFEIVIKRGANTRLSNALRMKLIVVAKEFAKIEKTRMPRKEEVLLVSLPFDEFGHVEIPMTYRVPLNHKDKMRIIGDTVKAVVDWTRMMYAATYKISGLE